MQIYEFMLSRIEKADFSVCVVGLGYVGLPLALLFAKKKLKVHGIDTSDTRIKELNSGVIPFSHLNNSINRDLLSSEYFSSSTSYECIKDADVIIVCVPTPITKYLEPDLSFIIKATQMISSHMRPGQLIILESTTYPGTTEEIIVPLLAESNLYPGKDVFLGYSPEREDPANPQYTTENIPKIVSGITDKCLSLTSAVYSRIINEIVPVSSTRVAELSKLVENIHRSVNIGLMNELKPLCNKMGIDIFEVIKAASTKPFGFTPYYPGPGLGGHCIPIDPFYLSWKAREFGIKTKFIELAAEINADMPNYVLLKIIEALNKKGKSLSGSNLLFLGVAYKKNVEDTRSSPAITIIGKALNSGANVKYCDPYIHEIRLDRCLPMKSSEIEIEILSSCDIIVLLTDHDSFDYDTIYQYSACIVDTRGRFCISDKVIRG